MGCCKSKRRPSSSAAGDEDEHLTDVEVEAEPTRRSRFSLLSAASGSAPLAPATDGTSSSTPPQQVPEAQLVKEAARLHPLLGLAVSAGGKASKSKRFGANNFVIENPKTVKLDEYYEVMWDEKLGEGSFGRINPCRNRSTGMLRALKTVRKMRKSVTELVRKEISIMKQMAHPNIVKLYETFEDATFIYMVMEHCSGGDLMEIISEKGRVTEGQAAGVMQQVLRGANFIHQNHVCHRDLKLENLMLLSDELIERTQHECCKEPTNPASILGSLIGLHALPRNILKIIDFGLAVDCPPGGAITTKAGGPYYCAPQVLAGYYDTRADVWTLGVVMYTILCGYPPFIGESDAEVLTKVRLGVYSFTAADWKSISEEAKDLIMNMLKMSPHDRLSCEEALKHRWFTSQLPPVKIGIPNNMIENLRMYGHSPRFKKAALFLVGVQLEAMATKANHDVFTTLDSNGEGILTLEELREGLMKSGISDFNEADAIVKGVDYDKNGAVGYGEFIAASMDKKLYAQDEVCWLAFRLFDRQGDGTISKKEISAVLKDRTIPVEKEMEALGVAPNAKIDFNKFVKIMRKNYRGDQTGIRQAASNVPDGVDAAMLNNVTTSEPVARE